MSHPFEPLSGGLREAWTEGLPAERLRRAATTTRELLLAFVAFCPSSELTASMLAPGLKPTFSFRPPEVGTLIPTARG